MTRLFNDPDDFAEEMIEGFVAASARWVRPVTGGVVRSTRGSEPTVAVVIGGGSGHYPAFGGLVGPGLAHGAAMGNLFASPSAHQVQSVATAAHEGRGVLLSFGNYAGDVLHFGQTQARLRDAGIDCRTVLVTDDVWSAPKDDLDRRRGIAGDLVVFKVAGAAAEEGAGLDDVERVARLANARTRSFGVAFGGCTLPGADGPLFDVPTGRMAVGLGIHGEPGIDEVDVPTAAQLAEMFVAKLLDELPDGVSLPGARVVPILNGLGSVKYEELFVVYRSIDRLLTAAGAVVVSPEVGEFCTSFDMAGASLTLLWLDDELERLWLAPCDTPAFRRGAVPDRRAVGDDEIAALDEAQEIGEATDASRAAATVIARAVSATAVMLDAHADELGRLDRVAGDGDHGIGMQRGSRAAAEAAQAAVDAGAGARTALEHAGEAWADKGGGTSGAIWGEMLSALGAVLGDDDAVTAERVTTGVVGMKDAVMAFGDARPGDKTMIDAIVPFVDDLAERVAADDALTDAWAHAAEVATAAAQQTSELTARLGRARSHGDRSLGTPDPGAVSFALVAHTVLDVLKEED
ncbi:dihydroxyacetone kinase family protein [Microbacterium sp. zg.Y1090]|uniref:dihydroxyacetone kinase family protein n=1 Tax=Microbacterium wangruii TaxID=3049073 RepID=UPI00214D6450|nr:MULTISPECIES: dihydroxyacetone kinase family protein [unclassified Microbacterium]MCR2819699.1 dihydroxyacetone kinase family protein [Microbacterium sp. zg.Y1090]MDL5487547.1 dihydroxyacetone kinase family protein [Microbacterium sp. zg-Y1211]WIM28057.1 dihydroxyacetone kinase family protein [Microbacterium sp. zg-Y1090]